MTLAVLAGPPKSGRPRSRFYTIAQRIAKRFSPEVARAFLRAVERIQAQIRPEILEDAVASGSLEQVLAALRQGELRTILEGRREVEDALRRTATATGNAGADVLTNVTGIRTRFNAVDPNVVLYARTQAAQMIRAVTEDQREAVRIILSVGQTQGLTVKQQAVAIKEVVGLAPNMVQAPVNFANELREGRFDSSRRLFVRDKNQIRRALDAGTVDEAFIAKMQGRYADSLLTLRAQTVSRTETLAASNQGMRIGWRQAIKQGSLPRTARRVVVVTPDERLRPEHAVIPSMNPGGIPIDDGHGFRTPWGIQPGPPWPADPYNCRCSEGLIFPGRPGVL